MRAKHSTLLAWATVLSLVLTVTCSSGSSTSYVLKSSVLVNGNGPLTVNLDGDLSLGEFEDQALWNPHSTGLIDASKWSVAFTDELAIALKTGLLDFGHVAAGAWWTGAFKLNEKLPLYSLSPVVFIASFRANVASARCVSGQEWLRFALAFAVQRNDGSVVYTELDFWDSEKVTVCEQGTVRLGGNVVYRGGDVVEYKIGQAAVGNWVEYSLDLGEYFDVAWSARPGDVLESVYFVVEVVGEVEVLLKADDLWIAMFDGI